MSFERMGPVPMPEAAAQPATGLTATPGAAGEVPPALRLQILATEHWSLLATRSMAWSEMFARAGMFLSTLSGAIVALALVGQGSGFGSTFALFGIVILPVVLFIGITTFFRMGATNRNDAWCVIGMNRIRAAYFEIAPDLERFFVTSAHDDMRGVGLTMGVDPTVPMGVHFLAATPVIVMVINAVLAGAIVGLIAAELGIGTALAVAASVVVFLIAFLIETLMGRAAVNREQASLRPMFPGPTPPA